MSQNTINPRTVMHTSQRRLSVNTSPDAINLTPNGEPMLLYTPSSGLHWVVKHNNIIYNVRFQEGGVRDRNTYVEKNLIVRGDIKGSRLLLNFGNSTAISSSGYMKTINGVTMSSDIGFTMHRPGSIVGASCRFQCTSYTSDSNWNVDVLVNDTSSFQSDSVNVTSTTYFSTYGNQQRNINKFLAGDEVQIKMIKSSGTSSIDNMVGYIEIVFDS